MPIQIVRAKPIEREFEGWLMCAIDHEMSLLGVNADVWAVHPHEESEYPADEVFQHDGKVISFQVKQANCLCPGHLPSSAHAGCALGDLSWPLSKPAGQFAKVVARPEIYYVFPEFLNRNLRGNILDHTWFWRPAGTTSAGRVWAKGSKRRKRDRLGSGTSLRWSALMRAFAECSIGKPVKEGEAILSIAGALEQHVEQSIRSRSVLITTFVPLPELSKLLKAYT